MSTPALRCAGLDRSGTPDPTERKTGRELYVVGLTAVSVGMEEVRDGFSSIRRECGMKPHEEFHGRQCPEWIQARVLRTADDTMGLRVAAFIYEKQSAAHNPALQSGPTPARFQVQAALALLERFFSQHRLETLWCDEDIQGREQQKAFETAVKRLHRAAHAGARINVRHRPSKSNDLIQLADIAVYGLSRLTRGLVKDPELRRLLEAMRDAAENVVEGPLPWGE